MNSIDSATTTALWLDRLDPPIVARPGLPGDVDVDVAIVGGGFSGLWTAYYLQQLDPGLRVAVVERHHCGFGASGRNGGWAVGELAGSFESYEALGGRDAAQRQFRAVFDSVDEIGRVLHTEDIDGDYAKGGTISLARTGPQAERAEAHVARLHSQGMTTDDVRMLDADDARVHLDATEIRSGTYFAHTASIDPAKVVRGLADTVERGGAAVYEQTTVEAIEPGRVMTDRGVVRAGIVVRATEAYTRDLEGERRTLLPVYSFMFATQPLEPEVLSAIGLHQRQTFADDRHMVIYGQRTADNRIAFGGAGVPYLFGSKISADNERHLETHRELHRVLVEMLPQLRDAQITHRWGGVLGIPRNWVPGLTFDRASGVASLGGYVGEGVVAANLAGRTLAELIVGVETERTSLPWVGANARKWEPEPFRWLGVRGSRAVLARADATETRTDQESTAARWLSRLLRG